MDPFWPLRCESSGRYTSHFWVSWWPLRTNFLSVFRQSIRIHPSVCPGILPVTPAQIVLDFLGFSKCLLAAIGSQSICAPVSRSLLLISGWCLHPHCPSRLRSNSAFITSASFTADTSLGTPKYFRSACSCAISAHPVLIGIALLIHLCVNLSSSQNVRVTETSCHSCYLAFVMPFGFFWH
jgi:hypothetical protein